MFVRTSMLAVFIFGIVSATAASDGDISLRYRLSYGKSWFTGTTLAVAGQEVCPSFGDFNGIYSSQSVGLGISFLGIGHFSIDGGVQTMVAYGQIPGDSLPSLDPNGKVIFCVVQYEGSISLFDGYIRPSVAIDLPLGITAECGARILFNASNNVTIVLRLISDDSVVFDRQEAPGVILFDNDRAMVTSRGPIPSLPPTRIDIDIAVGKSFVIDDVTIQLQAMNKSD